jgi:hypothetical protein
MRVVDDSRCLKPQVPSAGGYSWLIRDLRATIHALPRNHSRASLEALCTPRGGASVALSRAKSPPLANVTEGTCAWQQAECGRGDRPRKAWRESDARYVIGPLYDIGTLSGTHARVSRFVTYEGLSRR